MGVYEKHLMNSGRQSDKLINKNFRRFSWLICSGLFTQSYMHHNVNIALLNKAAGHQQQQSLNICSVAFIKKKKKIIKHKENS